MGYYHSLSTEGKLKESVTLDQLVAAFKPLLNYFGYDGHKAFYGTEVYESHEFHWLPNTREFSVYTCGDVSYDYDELVKDVAKELGSLVEQPYIFILKNFDTADLDNAVTEIVYGESEAVIKQYKTKRDINQAMFILEKYLPKGSIDKIRAMIKEGIDLIKDRHVSNLVNPHVESKLTATVPEPLKMNRRMVPYIGILTMPKMDPIEVDFEAPEGADTATKDAAFLKALGQIGYVQYDPVDDNCFREDKMEAFEQPLKGAA